MCSYQFVCPWPFTKYCLMVKICIFLFLYQSLCQTSVKNELDWNFVNETNINGINYGRRLVITNIEKQELFFVCIQSNFTVPMLCSLWCTDSQYSISSCYVHGWSPSLFFSHMSLNLALQFILEALKKPSSSKMHSFGLAAIDKFCRRLKEFPRYCTNIINLPHFANFPHPLKQVSYNLMFLLTTLLHA